MANEEIASQVLDYWFAIEFLGQDSYDVCTEESKLVRVQIPLHRITDSASNGSVFPVVTEHFSASSDHAFL